LIYTEETNSTTRTVETKGARGEAFWKLWWDLNAEVGEREKKLTTITSAKLWVVGGK